MKGTVTWLILAIGLLVASPALSQEAAACTVGGEIQVLWNGTWYDSTIKAGPNELGQCQIGYDGWDSSWDEWVGTDRMRERGACAVGSGIEVLWNGTWYASTIKAGPNEQGQCQIGYDGWDSSWDEWVGSDRMRPRTGQ